MDENEGRIALRTLDRVTVALERGSVLTAEGRRALAALRAEVMGELDQQRSDARWDERCSTCHETLRRVNEAGGCKRGDCPGGREHATEDLGAAIGRLSVLPIGPEETPAEHAVRLIEHLMAALAAKDEEIAALQRDRDEWQRVSRAMESARDAAWGREAALRAERNGLREDLSRIAEAAYDEHEDQPLDEDICDRVRALRAERDSARADLADEVDESTVLVVRLGELLRGTANALKGEPPPLTRHSTHDLPEVAAQLMADLARLRAREERTAAVVEAALVWDERPGDHALCVALSDAVGRVRALDATPEHARGPSGVERRIEYRDIGLPHPVGYCTACGLPVDCLSGEDVCSCDVPRCGVEAAEPCPDHGTDQIGDTRHWCTHCQLYLIATGDGDLVSDEAKAALREWDERREEPPPMTRADGREVRERADGYAARAREVRSELEGIRNGLEPIRALIEERALFGSEQSPEGRERLRMAERMRGVLARIAHLAVVVCGAALLAVGCAGSHARYQPAGDAGEPAAAEADAGEPMAQPVLVHGAWEAPAYAHDAGAPMPEGRWTWELLGVDGAGVPTLRCGWEGTPSPFPMDDSEFWVQTHLWLWVDGELRGLTGWWTAGERCEAGAAPRFVEWGPVGSCTEAELVVQTARARRESTENDLEQTVHVPIPCGAP